MKTRFFIIIAVLLSYTSSAQLVIDLTTGVSGPAGSPDATWEVKVPGAAVFVPAFISSNQVVFGSGSASPYSTNNCGNWISPYIADGTNHVVRTKASGDAVEPGDYTYRMSFELDTCEVTSAIFNLNRIGADNSVSEVIVNGNSYTFPVVNFSPLATRVLSISPGDLIPGGANVIEFTVNNVSSYTAFMICGNLTINRKNCRDCGALPAFDIVSFNTSKSDCNKRKFINNSTWTGGTPVSYHWDFGDGSTSVLSDPTHAYQYNGTYNVTLTMSAIDENGVCCTETITKQVVINCPCALKPSIAVAEMECVFTFSGSSPFGGTTHPVAWHWDFGDGVVGSGPVVSHEYDENGEYEITLTVVGYNGTECCSKEVKTKIQVDCVKGCEIEVDFSYTTDDENDEIDFTNLYSISGGFGTVNYFWDFGDGFTSTLENPSHAYEVEGDYLVTLTVYSFSKEGCCSEQITLNVHVDYDKIPVLGGNDDGISLGFKPAITMNGSPNPVENQFTMQLTEPVSEKVSYQVINLEGSVLVSGEFDGDTSQKLLLTDLKAGMYILSYTVAGERKQVNFIKK
ncbi:MAG: PKD domain-containing protein [Bacteroidota bacterium]